MPARSEFEGTIKFDLLNPQGLFDMVVDYVAKFEGKSRDDYILSQVSQQVIAEHAAKITGTPTASNEPPPKRKRGRPPKKKTDNNPTVVEQVLDQMADAGLLEKTELPEPSADDLRDMLTRDLQELYTKDEGKEFVNGLLKTYKINRFPELNDEQVRDAYDKVQLFMNAENNVFQLKPVSQYELYT